MTKSVLPSFFLKEKRQLGSFLSTSRISLGICGHSRGLNHRRASSSSVHTPDRRQTSARLREVHSSNHRQTTHSYKLTRPTIPRLVPNGRCTSARPMRTTGSGQYLYNHATRSDSDHVPDATLLATAPRYSCIGHISNASRRMVGKHLPRLGGLCNDGN